jgi:hypothetical protein
LVNLIYEPALIIVATVVVCRASLFLGDYAPSSLPPWSVEELEACFVVRDHDGQQSGYGL